MPKQIETVETVVDSRFQMKPSFEEATAEIENVA